MGGRGKYLNLLIEKRKGDLEKTEERRGEIKKRYRKGGSFLNSGTSILTSL